MARILEYQQDKLASAAVGVPDIDRSGQMIGRGVAEAAGQIATASMAAEKQRKEILDTAKAAEAISKYETGLYDQYTANIDDKGNQANPSQFANTFPDIAKKTFDSLQVGQYSPEVQRLVNLKRIDLDTNYHKKVKEWSRNQENFNASTALVQNVTRVSNSVFDAARRGQLNDAAQLMRGLDTTAASSMSVLGPEEAQKLLMQANRNPREALYAGLLESDPVMASKVLDDPQMDYKSHFTADEMQQKRTQATQAIAKWHEHQAVKILQNEVENNQALSRAISEGNTPWKVIAQMPDTPFKEWAVKGMTALENASMTETDKAYEKDRLKEQFRALYTRNKEGRHSIEVLQDINNFMVQVERAKAIGAIDAKTALKWHSGAVDAIKNDAVERNLWNKMTSVGGMKGSNAIMRSWEAIDTWSKGSGKGIKDVGSAQFDIFTRVIDQLDPGKAYNDQEIEDIVATQTGAYMRSRNPKLKMSTYSMGVVQKGGGYTPFRSGPSPEAVPGASVDKSARKAYNLNMSDGTKRKGYLDAKTGKYYDRPVGGVEIK